MFRPMTVAIETDSSEVGESTYEVVFCAPGEALGASNPQWFIEGCYSAFEDAQRAAREMIASTDGRLHTVTILHARFDAGRGAFLERVVWSQDRAITLLSRLNLQPLQLDQRHSIVAYCDQEARKSAQLARTPAPEEAEIATPSPLLVLGGGALAAAACAVGVFLILT
jgi:hypothetical protein